MANSLDSNDSVELRNYRDNLLQSQSQLDSPSNAPPATPSRQPTQQTPSQIHTSPINLDYTPFSQISLGRTQPSTLPLSQSLNPSQLPTESNQAGAESQPAAESQSQQPAKPTGDSQPSDLDLLSELTHPAPSHLFDESRRFTTDSSSTPVTPLARRFPKLATTGAPNLTQIFEMSSPVRPVGDSPAFKGSAPTPLRKLQMEDTGSMSSPIKKRPAKSYVSVEESQEKKKKMQLDVGSEEEWEEEDEVLKRYRRKVERRREEEKVDEELKKVKIPGSGRRGRVPEVEETQEVPETVQAVVSSPPPPSPRKDNQEDEKAEEEEKAEETADEEDHVKENQEAEETEGEEEIPASPAEEDWRKLPSSIPHRPPHATSDIEPATIADSQPPTQASPTKKDTMTAEKENEEQVLLRASPEVEEEQSSAVRRGSTFQEVVAETSPAGTAAPIHHDEDEEEDHQEEQAKSSPPPKKRKRTDPTSSLSPVPETPKPNKRSKGTKSSPARTSPDHIPNSPTHSQDVMDLDPELHHAVHDNPPSKTPKSSKQATEEPTEETTQEESQAYKMLTSPTTKRTPRVYGNPKSGIGSKSTVRRAPARTPLNTSLSGGVPATMPARKTRSTTSLRQSLTGSGLFDSRDNLFSPASDISSFSTPLPNRQPSLPINISTTTSSNTPAAKFPNRVFALFKNTQNYHYPATYSPTTHSVTFDDNTIVPYTPTLLLRSLILKENDRVKVTGDGSTVYHVCKVEECVTPTLTGDIDGNEFVLLRAQKRKSLSSEATSTAPEIRKIPIKDLYLPRSLVNQFPPFHPPTPHPSSDKPPSLSTSTTPTPTTPTRSRTTPKAPLLTSPSGSRQKDGPLFSNHTISLTLGPHEPLKLRLSQTLTTHGATLLDSSFESLFTLPPLTPSSSTSPTQLQLNPENSDLGRKRLVVVADAHCRRAKFLQALALGIPVVHHKWVTDCVAASRIIPLSPYQLPSGESKYLDNTIVSRSLPHADEDLGFAEMVERRDQLLGGKKMIFVTGGAGGSGRRAMYWFLVCCLSASATVVTSLDEARKLLSTSSSQNWDYVYIDAPPSTHAHTAKKGGVVKAKRSKASLKKEGEGEWKVGEKMGGVRVVDDEWIVQSLILGRGLDCF